MGVAARPPTFQAPLDCVDHPGFFLLIKNTVMSTQKSQAQAQNELMIFNYSESQTEIRNTIIDDVPYFVGIDIAKALGYKKPINAIRQHCRYSLNQGLPHPQSKTKQVKVLVIPESDVYRLIMKSTLPTAEKFERWVMEEVLPSIRKKGYYLLNKGSKTGGFIDARHIAHSFKELNDTTVRYITIDDILYFSVNDVNRAIGSATPSYQVAKKLKSNAVKIFIYGNTNPAWFATLHGVELMFAGSRKLLAQKINYKTMLGGLS